MQRIVLANALRPRPTLPLVFYPNAVPPQLQLALLRASLAELDRLCTSVAQRTKLRKWRRSSPEHAKMDGFLPEEVYEFEKGHFDAVIRSYREANIPPSSAWTSFEALRPLYELVAPRDPEHGIFTHVLHLSARGHISPHVDNEDAFADTIAGVSLGSTRTVRFAPVPGQSTEEPFELELPPGSVYIQRGSLRAGWTHEIAPGDGQRVSIMLRNKHPAAAA